MTDDANEELRREEMAKLAVLHAANVESKQEATDAAFTPEEMEEIRARARGDLDITATAEERLCVDYWGADLQPKNHQPRPGTLSIKGHAVSAGCNYVLADPFPYTAKKNEQGWKLWRHATLTHKEQCLACRLGTSIL